jgi:hypothetical protein
VDGGRRPRRKHLLELLPIKHGLSGGLLFHDLRLPRLRYRSVALFQGVPLHDATGRVLVVLLGPMESTSLWVVSPLL